MVHVRLNERETNPNPHINFITPLRMADPAAEEEARQLLRALAAQVRPIMKAQGFTVNSFEEYEHNQVFAGRNWNNGETIELVLRGAGGNFLPMSWLLSTLCHELAHIKHMNHGPAFQALWTKLRNDVRDLQSKGYYGDGYWSSGTRLADSARMSGQGLEAGDLPEYMCGGAQSRTRPTAVRRRRTRSQAGPSNHTGAQTAKKRKAGSRVTAKGLFQGAGKALNEDVEDEEQKKAGTGFRKKAGSKRAREERALAAERRLLALQGKAGNASTVSKDESADDEQDSDYEDVPETDQDRRHAVLDSADKTELDGLKAWQRDYSSDFILPPVASSSGAASPPGSSTSSNTNRKHLTRTLPDLGTIELSSDEEQGPQGCDTLLLPRGGTAASSSTVPLLTSKQREERSVAAGDAGRHSSKTSSAKKQQKLPYGNLVQDEIKSRTKESLGMTGPGKRLGGAPSDHSGLVRAPPRVEDRPTTSETPWSCAVCTLQNEPAHLACAACATPRGESVWTGNAV
ncbi:WLM-domain-containing protein [Polyporus arcularius HHB13444]|uniref:WLM-domain-containing protein n=1 Tax=Polyporus arcularius HHB13444 TaxID=1314778 RepID=A0A5C3PXN7_9APHY|nr:WLM-domain-containing protein [Polyporus arcularius HHB13444]